MYLPRSHRAQRSRASVDSDSPVPIEVVVASFQVLGQNMEPSKSLDFPHALEYRDTGQVELVLPDRALQDWSVF